MPTFRQALFALLAFGLLELVLLWQLGEILGFWPTLLWLFASAAIGFYAGKAQGLAVFRRWRDREQDSLQDEGLVDGLLVLAGSLLLLMPGLVGDLVGLVLLTPPIRRRIAERIRLRAAGWIQAGSTQVFIASDELEADEQDEPPPSQLRVEAIGVEVIETEGLVIEAEGVTVEEVDSEERKAEERRDGEVETRPSRLLGP